MPRYCGIDVGERLSFACSLDTDAMQVFWPAGPLATTPIAEWVIGQRPALIAIDSPPAPSKGVLGALVRAGLDVGTGGLNRRVAEWRLGIGGCYATPAEESAAPAWMQSGMAIYRALASRGLPVDLGNPDAPVFEVHPTYGFRSLVELEQHGPRILCDPRRLLRPKRPVGSVGHLQRIQLLKDLLGRWQVRLDEDSRGRVSTSLDWTDGLLAACLAALRGEHLTVVAGDDDGIEGRLHLAAVRVELREAAPEALPRRSSRVGGSQGENGRLLRLGGEGLGHFTQEETLGLMFEQIKVEGGIVLPLGVARIAGTTLERTEETGLRLLLAHGKTVRLELRVYAVRGHGRDLQTESIEWGDRESVWGNTLAPYWAFADEALKVDRPLDGLLFRHGKEWRRGPTKGQSAWLRFREPEEPERR
jgi:hypothetical protein